MRVLVLWPDGPRYVDESTVIGWALDSYANGAPRFRCVDCGADTLTENGCEHEDYEPKYDAPTNPPAELEAAIEWLSNTGEITFALERDTEAS